MSKKGILQESAIFQTLRQVFAAEEGDVAQRSVNAHPYTALHAVLEVTDAREVFQQRRDIIDRCSDALDKKNQSIAMIPRLPVADDQKKIIESRTREQAANIVRDASRELETHHAKWLARTENIDKFTGPKAREEYVNLVASALLCAITDRADQVTRLGQFRPNPLIDIVAKRKKIDNEVRQLEKIAGDIEEKLEAESDDGESGEALNEALNAESGADKGLEDLYAQLGVKHEAIVTLHEDLMATIREDLPQVVLNFWEDFPAVYESIRIHVEFPCEGMLFEPTSPRVLRSVLMALIYRVVNFQATLKEEFRPLFSQAVVGSLSTEHKEKYVSGSKNAQLAVTDYSQLSWSSRFGNGLDDIRVFESAILGGVSSFLHYPVEAQNAEGRQTVLDWGSKLEEVADAYRDALLSLADKFSDENMEELSPESRQQGREDLVQRQTELEYRSYLFKATGLLVSIYAEMFIPLAVKNEPKEDQALAHIHEIRQSINEVAQEEKRAGEPDTVAVDEPEVRAAADEVQATSQPDSAVKDAGQSIPVDDVSAATDRASSPESALIGEAVAFHESFKDYCMQANNESIRHEEAPNFVSGRSALLQMANHYTDAAQCCNEAQLRLQAAGRSCLPIVNIREKPVGIKDLKEKTAYYLDEALLHFRLAHDIKSKRPSERNLKKVDEDGEMELNRPSNFFRRVGIDTPDENMIVEGRIGYSPFRCADVQRSLSVKVKYAVHVHFPKDLTLADLQGLRPAQIAPLIVADSKGRVGAHIKLWAQRYRGNAQNSNPEEDAARVVYENISREYAAELVYRILNEV